MMWNGWNGMGFVGWTMMIVFWVAIVALAVWTIRTAAPRNGSMSALDILERRYASGEIDGDEFQQRKRLLDDSRSTRR
jgi:putative membrane protein